MRDFEILKKAQCAHRSRRGIQEGCLIKYNGDVYFVYDPDHRLNIEDCELWCEIERNWCFDEYDPETYSYYEAEGILRPLVMDGTGEAVNE